MPVLSESRILLGKLRMGAHKSRLEAPLRYDPGPVLVAARKAWPEYQEQGLYFCQANRSFKPVDHLAFYTDGEIKTAVPSVTDAIESIELTEETVRNHTDLSQSQREQLLDAVTQFRGDESERRGFPAWEYQLIAGSGFRPELTERHLL